MNDRRVVVTGLGTINPIGDDVESTWQGLLSGTSGVGPITQDRRVGHHVAYCG